MAKQIRVEVQCDQCPRGFATAVMLPEPEEIDAAMTEAENAVVAEMTALMAANAGNSPTPAPVLSLVDRARIRIDAKAKIANSHLPWSQELEDRMRGEMQAALDGSLQTHRATDHAAPPPVAAANITQQPPDRHP